MKAYELGVNKPIELQTMHATLGEGFNTFDLSSRPGGCLISQQSLEESNKSKRTLSKDVNLECSISETSEELATSLNIKSALAFKCFGVSVKGAAEYLAKTKIDETSLVASVQGLAQHATLSLVTNPTLTKGASRVLANPVELLRKYGDYYCHKLIYGGELIIFIVIKTSSVDEKRDIKASLGVKWGVGGANASTASEFERITKNCKKEYKIYQRGKIALQKEQDLKNLLDTASEFLDKSEEFETNLIRAEYRPITQLACEEPGVMRDLKERLKPAWRNRDDYLNYLGEYNRLIHEYADKASPREKNSYYLPTAYYKKITRQIHAHIKQLETEVTNNAGEILQSNPKNIITDFPPEYYLENLEKHEIKKSDSCGGPRGGPFEDPIKNLEGLTEIEFSTNPGSGGVIGYIRTKTLLKDRKLQEGVYHGKTRGTVHRIKVKKGEYIKAIEVRGDQFVRQITFWIRQKDDTLKQMGPYPKELNPQLAELETIKFEDIILCGLYGRSGKWLDALGFNYIELGKPGQKNRDQLSFDAVEVADVEQIHKLEKPVAVAE